MRYETSVVGFNQQGDNNFHRIGLMATFVCSSLAILVTQVLPRSCNIQETNVHPPGHFQRCYHRGLHPKR